ncbi:MAG: hypothetical protein ABI859_08110 [Pseudomonadota bacterium]
MKSTKRKIGLYQVTTTSRDLADVVEAGGLRVTPALERMRAWAADVEKQALALSKSRKYPSSVRNMAKRCASPAFLTLNFLAKAKWHGTLPAFEVAQAMEAAVELADEWHSVQVNATLEQQVSAHQRSSSTGRSNVAGANLRAATRALEGHLKAVNVWANDPRRSTTLAGKSDTEKVIAYLKVASPKPSDRRRRKLNAWLRANAPRPNSLYGLA